MCDCSEHHQPVSQWHCFPLVFCSISLSLLWAAWLDERVFFPVPGLLLKLVVPSLSVVQPQASLEARFAI